MEALMPMLNDAIAAQLRQYPYDPTTELGQPMPPTSPAPPPSAGSIATQVLMTLAPLALGIIAGGGEGEPPPERPPTRPTGELRPADPLAGRPTRLLKFGTRPLYNVEPIGVPPEQREYIGLPFPRYAEEQEEGRFHGTYPERPMLTLGDPKQFANPGLFGKGLYTTDNYAVASGYAREGEGYIYRIHEIRPVRFLENQQTVPDEVWAQLAKRPAWRQLQQTKPHIKVGEILHMYSPYSMPIGLRSRAAADEFIAAAQRAGYGGFKHIGGGGPARGTVYHQVKIYWNPEQDVRPRLVGGGSARGRGVNEPLPAGLSPETERELERLHQDFVTRKYYQEQTGLSGPQPPHRAESVVLPPPDTSFLKPLKR